MLASQIAPLTEREERNFWRKVSPTGFCWEWTAHKISDGYGGFAVARVGKKYVAHRVSYTLLVGPVAGDLELDHLCRNRACENPDHLDPVTRAVNLSRIPSPLTGGAGKMPNWVTSGKNITGLCVRGHEYTDENTYTYKDGRTECRICKKINAAGYRARRKLALAA